MKDYKRFRHEDKYRVLELLLTHENLLTHLYQKIFPNSFSNYIKSLSTSEEAKSGYMAELVAKLHEDKSFLSGDELNPTSDQPNTEGFEVGPTRLPTKKDRRSLSMKNPNTFNIKNGKVIFGYF